MRGVLWFIFWCIFVPLIRFLRILFFWHPKVKERVRFEKRNKFEWLAHSFKELNQTADLCFQFSSEGEYQQVASLIDDALAAGKKLELVFFSPSVEKAVMKLAAHHPDQVRYLRYPFVRIFPFIQRRCFFHWVTAKTLVMVRYDLFPEFLLWAMDSEHTLVMIWMTFKKERSLNTGPSFWKKLFLKSARKIVYAGAPDAEQGLTLQFPGETFDFRQEQIRRRVEKRREKFRHSFPLYPEFQEHMKRFEKRLIVGNAWPSDLFLLRDLPRDIFLVLVPHQLSHDILAQFRQAMTTSGNHFFELTNNSFIFEEAPVLLVNQKGILCELYADFSHAYVGGGFEGSIHSVLEPFIAGSEKIACGPRHHRSTEYDIAASAGRIAEINSPEQFLEWFNSAPVAIPRDKMKPQTYQAMREFVISC